MTIQERIDAIKAEQAATDQEISAMNAKMAEQDAALAELETAYSIGGTPTAAKARRAR